MAEKLNKQYHNLTVFGETLFLGSFDLTPNGRIRKNITGCICPECSNLAPLPQPTRILMGDVSNGHFFPNNDWSSLLPYIQETTKTGHSYGNDYVMKDPSDTEARAKINELLMKTTVDHDKEEIPVDGLVCSNCGWTPDIPDPNNQTDAHINGIVLYAHMNDENQITYKIPENYIRINKAIEITDSNDKGEIVHISRKISLAKGEISNNRFVPATTQIYSQDYNLEEHALTETLIEKDEKTGKETTRVHKDISDIFKNHANLYTHGYRHHKNNYNGLTRATLSDSEYQPLFLPSKTLRQTLLGTDDRGGRLRHTQSQINKLQQITQTSRNNVSIVPINAFIKDNIMGNIQQIAAQKAKSWGYTDPVLVSEGIGQYIYKNQIGAPAGRATATNAAADTQFLVQMLVKYPAMYHQILEKTNDQLSNIIMDKMELFKQGKIKSTDLATTDRDKQLVMAINIKDGITKLAMMPDSMLLKIRKANNLQECKDILSETLFTDKDRKELKYGPVSDETVKFINDQFEKDPIATACNMWTIATFTPKDGRNDETLKRWYDVILPTERFNKDRFKLMCAKDPDKNISGSLYKGMYEHSVFPAFSGMLQCPSGQESKLARIYMMHHTSLEDPTGVKDFIKNVYRQGYTYKIFQTINKRIEKYEQFKAECGNDLDTAFALIALKGRDDNKVKSPARYIETLTEIINTPDNISKAHKIACDMFDKCLQTRFMQQCTPDQEDYWTRNYTSATSAGRNKKIHAGEVRFNDMVCSAFNLDAQMPFCKLEFENGDKYIHALMSKHIYDFDNTFNYVLRTSHEKITRKALLKHQANIDVPDIPDTKEPEPNNQKSPKGSIDFDF